ncbi:hypothetical protein Hanom_Chr00s164814g01826411 [Helianthus anomalus]
MKTSLFDQARHSYKLFRHGLKNGWGVRLEVKRPKTFLRLRGFILYLRLRGAKGVFYFLIFLFFDFLCQLQAIYVSFMCVFYDEFS